MYRKRKIKRDERREAAEGKAFEDYTARLWKNSSLVMM